MHWLILLYPNSSPRGFVRVLSRLPEMAKRKYMVDRWSAALVIWTIAGLMPIAPAAGQISFNRQIQPILSKHCAACHGPDEGSRQADLRLDTLAGATSDLGGYQAIVPGDPDSSELMIRINSDDDPMPPEDHRRLNEQETELLTRWISEGAEYETHWAFVAPRRPPVPQIPGDQWSTSPVDRFVRAALDDRSLTPNPPADRQRLLRRLALDLTGLPPDPALAAWWSANPEPEYYEVIVDRLLADPAFGEHWASMWLDLARYADTVGYASDETRTIWPWRDWVIRALNDNLPFDQFTTWQLAGDLLDQPGVDQQLATAFHRNTLNNNEGGTNDEEFRMLAVKDRASTTASTWLGLTIRCAECHSHKFDPVSHREYYQFLDFLNQTADADRSDEFPVLKLTGISGQDDPVSVPVLQELAGDQPRKTYVHQRGNFRSPGPVVTAAVPDFLHAWPEGARRDRHGLARWLFADDNPLTARVTVNRLWSRVFGRGLVETEEDFGTQGSPPSHPELLDWLAIEFRESEWDVKQLIKQLVMSSTYRQSAVTTPDNLQADPDNVWLSRGPRNRLSAEVLRDQALAISGLLSRKMYGPPVFPPNPIRSVTNAFQGTEVWTTSQGEDRYRRAIYTFLKRSQPHPLFETFDMGTRDVCSLRRIETNTPLQSFMTLNDEAFVEAAQALAVRMSAADTVDCQIAFGLQRALGRVPDCDQIRLLTALYCDSLAKYQREPESARQMAGAAARDAVDERACQLAALAVVANVILNLDAVLTK